MSFPSSPKSGERLHVLQGVTVVGPLVAPPGRRPPRCPSRSPSVPLRRLLVFSRGVPGHGDFPSVPCSAASSRPTPSPPSPPAPSSSAPAPYRRLRLTSSAPPRSRLGRHGGKIQVLALDRETLGPGLHQGVVERPGEEVRGILPLVATIGTISNASHSSRLSN